jgi:hypothetical protein
MNIKSKKGYDGMYFMIALLVGFFLGAGLVAWATMQGYLTSFLCPVP